MGGTTLESTPGVRCVVLLAAGLVASCSGPVAERSTVREPSRVAAAPEPQPAWRVDVPELSEEPSIRVLLGQRETVTVSGEGLRVGGLAGADRLVVGSSGEGLTFEDPRCAYEGCEIEAPAGITVEDLGEFQGIVHVVPHAEAVLVVLDMGLEPYVAGVVSGEIPAVWGLETKKALAVAARSYALVQMNRRTGPFDVVATAMDQVYRSTTNPGAVDAAAQTRGQVLVGDGVLIETFYHSTCGGTTEDPRHVWHQAGPWTWATTCDTCARSPRYRWQATLSGESVSESAIEGTSDPVTDIRIDRRSPSGRVTELTLLTSRRASVFSGVGLRRLIGTSVLRSTQFEVTRQGRRLKFTGRGFGHGVGLCQWGAHGLEEAGSDYEAMLRHYYRDTTLARLYD